MATPDGKALLNGFNFNANSVLSGVLFKAFAVDAATGVITINNLIPQKDIAYPYGATHLALLVQWQILILQTGFRICKLPMLQNLPIDLNTNNVVLTPVAVPAGNGIVVSLLKIEFFQLMNGVQYPLKNGNYNTCQL